MRVIGGQIPGGLADAVVVPVANLIPVPAEVPSSLSALAEPLAVAVHAVRRVRVESQDRCAVLGGGPIGTLAALVLRHSGCRDVTLVDPSSSRRSTAERLGFTARDACTADDAFDYAFDCVGGSAPAASALASVAPGGTVVLVGIAAATLAFDGVLLQRQERTVMGSQMYARTDFEGSLSLLADGLLPEDPELLPLIFTEYSLQDAPQAVEAIASGAPPSALKVVVRP